jgi:uncharacterized protein HemX
MDDIRPPRNTNYQNTPTRTPYNATSTPQARDAQQGSPADSQGDVYQQDTETHEHMPEYALPQAKKSNKGLIVSLIIVIVLMLAAVGFAAWEYMQIQDLNKQVTELTEKNASLTQKVDSLEYDNKDLTQKLEMANDEISSLEETHQLLLDTCGDACANVLH